MGVKVGTRHDHTTPCSGQTSASIEFLEAAGIEPIRSARDRSTDSGRSSSSRGSDASNERYRIIVETATEGIWTIDEKNLTTLANPALAEMLGYEPHEMLGKSVFDFMDPAYVDEAQRSLQLRREGVSEQLEFPFRAKDGRELWTQMATSSLYDSKGEYVGALAMVTDITARRAAAVERSRLAALVQSSADSIIGMSTDGVIESWNNASSRLYGYSANEVLGQHAPSLLARDASEREQLIARAAAGDDQSQVDTHDVGKDGLAIDVSVTVSAIRDSHGLVVGVSRIARDIGWRKRMEHELQYVAGHDWLTGLFNRRRLMPELDRCLAYAARYGRAGAVLSLDIDNFTFVNDTEGHDVGDRTLKSVATVLLGRARGTDIVARLGGDEFAIVLPEATEQDALEVASDLRSLLCERPGGPIKASVGISLFTPEQQITADDALVAADSAQYEAKEHGGDQARVFSGLAAGTLTWVERIRAALAEDRFLLYGQPIVDLRSGLVAYHELLIRMLSEDGKVIAPGAFLPTAERFGLIVEIDRWVTEHALRLAIDGERVTINLAGPSIGDERVLRLVREALADGLNPDNVIFEITETAAVSNFDDAERFAETLNGLGCNLALDDFGTGFGSFTYLKYLNARYLKIDVEFVRHLVSNDTDQKVVKSIVDIAHSLDKKTIAEGVESAATLTALKDRGVDYAQGFYLGRPKHLSPPRRARDSHGRETLPQAHDGAAGTRK
jgi:diguanylate cyclase (GGDEF)-like protein/PAS domain S-box-containing protein